jgi:hypothetical protein
LGRAEARRYATFHNISEAHLPRYLAEFDFRANTRDMTDSERADSLIASARGKAASLPTA